jgi:hypothetical protein
MKSLATLSHDLLESVTGGAVTVGGQTFTAGKPVQGVAEPCQGNCITADELWRDMRRRPSRRPFGG